MVSKSIELIDTAFIVLRKQKLIFLHWYHHAITLIYTWYSFRDLVAYGRWFIAMNYSIHAIMYSYYAFRALRFNIPKAVSIAITSLQLLQMLVGIFVNLVAGVELFMGRQATCRVTPENIYFSFLLYFSFFLLFFHYFRNAYLKKATTTTRRGSGAGEAKSNDVVDNENWRREKPEKGAKLFQAVFKKIN
jgi:elongation of very long chain fatty acids protein 6